MTDHITKRTILAVGTATLFLVDQPVQDFWMDKRSGFLEDVSDVAKRFKQPEMYWVAGPGCSKPMLIT